MYVQYSTNLLNELDLSAHMKPGHDRHGLGIKKVEISKLNERKSVKKSHVEQGKFLKVQGFWMFLLAFILKKRK